MSFEDEFSRWIDDSLAGDTPKSVKAFCFSLYEPAGLTGVKFGVELIGAGRFDENDPDWACDEVWDPQVRGVPIPKKYSGQSWESCLQKIKTLLLRKLSTNSRSVDRLKSSEAIGVGFVDGDLEVIWTADVRRSS